ncbi:16S rRNA (uracil(1498)-N(3))-methyltransferase [Gluconobacter cerinus]|uniref:16S rRNA (uracil(1498)-N(3))-methyltransferase n=1 Tax=Gluconobacter cerinus TaxID=38307 RepID=UPI001B8BB36E|nr:16S rRNA (uracil(1498)-N(3))-methyltransferase [Gluconobacter cerinus]MBS1024206.1 16S rRNA (uracil(1498)-N(3))-methyltransferase [Gluconobacter cerinus]MBS1043029.1 16S rRNA (uracil(1498)-N(3))-methyltransferase [Gluconobacter cerinus]
MAVARYRKRMSRSDPRLYLEVPDVPFTEGLELPLPASQAHYLGNVMRQSTGDPVRVFNARDGEWNAIIQTLRKDKGTVRLGTRERAPQVTEGVELLFAPLKRDATELVIRMGTELGVTCFRPVVTERTNTHRLNLDRLALIASEAAEQCERLDIPEIQPLEPLKSVLAEWPEDKPLFAALERRPGADGPLVASALLIGPEGGFSDAEVALLQKHPAVHAMTLGPLVLRAETAVCAGLARLALRRGA